MNKQLVRKFINKECTPEELKSMQHWLVSSGNEEEISALLKATWEHKNQNTKIDNQRKEEVYQELMTKTHLSYQKSAIWNNSLKEEPHRSALSFYQKHWWKLAAIILFIMGLFITDQYVFQKSIIQNPIAIVQKTNAKGQKSTITLKDGSKVYLNSESTIKYLENYGRQTREIELDGEAFFEVAKDPERPFIVRSGKITTTALGTSFNVRAFSEETLAQVSLATGKVKVERHFGYMESENDYILQPGEEALVKDGQFIKQQFDMEKVLSWKDGVIYFDNATLSETLKTLERWYDVTFKIKNLKPGNDIYGTGKFKNQSLENVLRILSHSMKFEFELNEREIILNF